MTLLLRILIGFVFVFSSFPQVLLAQEWQELKGEHFVVYFAQNRNFASKVLRKAERDYDRIASDLGYIRYSNFWTWSNRVKIYIHSDHESFIKASGQPNWSEGMADYRNKEIHSYSGSNNFLIAVLPHEMAHLIFRDFVGFEGEVPLWLDEGVAQWEEEVDKKRIIQATKEFLRQKIFLSLRDLMDLDIRFVKDTDQVHLRSTLLDGQQGFIIIDGKNLVSLYYMESASLVGFLIERYGTDKFTEFCRQLREGKNLEESLRFTYPTYLRNLDDLEEKWIAYLREE